MKWLIAGAAGQLGVALQEELTIRGIAFIAKNSSELDVTKPLIVNEVVDFIKPTVIVNAAAWTDVDGAESNKSAAYSVNSLGPQNLAFAANMVGARMVQVSTDYVFSGEASVPWSENAIHNPQSVYGSTKSEGESFVLRALPLKSYVIRTSWLYSSIGKNFAKSMTDLALNNAGDVSVVNDQIGQPTSSADLATNNSGNEARVKLRGTPNDWLSEVVPRFNFRAPYLMEVNTVAFFCVFLPRKVFERVGMIATEYGRGYFEDDDYCRRVQSLGYKIGIARDIFVHHKMGASFDLLEDSEKTRLFNENKAIYEAKWGKWVPHTYAFDSDQS